MEKTGGAVKSLLDIEEYYQVSVWHREAWERSEEIYKQVPSSSTSIRRYLVEYNVVSWGLDSRRSTIWKDFDRFQWSCLVMGKWKVGIVIMCGVYVLRAACDVWTASAGPIVIRQVRLADACLVTRLMSSTYSVRCTLHKFAFVRTWESALETMDATELQTCVTLVSSICSVERHTGDNDFMASFLMDDGDKHCCLPFESATLTLHLWASTWSHLLVYQELCHQNRGPVQPQLGKWKWSGKSYKNS